MEIGQIMIVVCVKKTRRRVHLRGGPGQIVEIASQYFSDIDLFGPRTPARHSCIANIIYDMNKIYLLLDNPSFSIRDK